MPFYNLENPVISNMERTGHPEGKKDDPWCWCDRCRKEIYRGETYLDLDGRFLCDSCLREFVHTAGEEETP